MNIYSLVPDIYQTIQRKDGWFNDAIATDLSNSVSRRLQASLNPAKRKATLRLSQMGPRCPKALWHSIHTPELAEPIPPWAEIKYSYGHILEALVIVLAKAAGHEVTGEQDELVLDGIVGHRDCVIDGCVVDVKSSSSLSFIKFKNGEIRQNDPFGYLDQLDGYVTASADDPLVRVKDKGYILAIDKQKGHVVLYEHWVRKEHIHERIRSYKEIVGTVLPPPCECRVVPEGKAGNMRLDTRASYSAYKRCCFPGLRSFAYASGPVDLTRVVREPDVPEIRYNRE